MISLSIELLFAKLHEKIEKAAFTLSEKRKELKEYIKTDVAFVDVAVARETSIKSINPTTYDRYEKYHYPEGEMSKVDKALSTVFSR